MWSQGISGDLPIVLIRIEETDDLPVVRQLLQAHEYWGIKRLSVDLVILNERGASYVQDLQVALESMVRVTQGRPRIAGADTRGKVFVLRADLITSETRGALFAVARVVLSGRRGSLADQVERMQPTPALAPRAAAACGNRIAAGERPSRRVARDLEFFNGLGGFRGAGARIHHRGHATHAGAMDQCHRQSRLRLSCVGRGQRLHLGAQQPREHAHALEQRSGHGSARRGDLPA